MIKINLLFPSLNSLHFNATKYNKLSEIGMSIYIIYILCYIQNMRYKYYIKIIKNELKMNFIKLRIQLVHLKYVTLFYFFTFLEDL